MAHTCRIKDQMAKGSAERIYRREAEKSEPPDRNAADGIDPTATNNQPTIAHRKAAKVGNKSDVEKERKAIHPMNEQDNAKSCN